MKENSILLDQPTSLASLDPSEGPWQDQNRRAPTLLAIERDSF